MHITLNWHFILANKVSIIITNISFYLVISFLDRALEEFIIRIFSSRTIAIESMNKKFGIRSYVCGRIFPFVPEDSIALKLSMQHTLLATMDAGTRPNESLVDFTRSSLLYRMDISL